MKVQLRAKAPDADIEKLLGTFAARSHASLWVTGDATVFKPDGSRLLTLIKGGVPADLAEQAYPFLHSLKTHTTRNRGDYGGLGRGHPVRSNGKVSNTNESPPVHSCIVGFMDRYPRIPFCRESALSSKDPKGWGEALPFIQEIAHIFEREVPGRYAAQRLAARNTHPAYVIPDTPFTTLTVNNTTAGAYHRDAGDFKPGFGVMACFRRGNYTGAELVLPAFGVGVDLEDRDLIFFDVHEVHGNTPIQISGDGAGEDFAERISVVLYFREKMVDCLAPAEELERAKARGALEPHDS